MTTVTATLTLQLVQDDNSADLTETQKSAAQTALKNSIRQRLFGDGFRPDEILVDTWDLAIK